MNISDVIMRAAGRATIRFNEEKDADSFYKCFPFLVERFAPSLKFTQAKVTIENNDFNKAFKDIEDILYQNRNINQVSLPEITPLIERNPRTGLASTNKEGEDLLDRQAQRKRDVARISIKLLSKIDKNISNQGEEDKWTDVIDDIAGTTNKYIAVIHADGNDLGKIIRKLKNKKIIKDFSYAVEDATQKAVKEAYEKVILCDYHKQRSLEKKDEAKEKIKIAARPIVIGGDDITMIVRADLAFEFTRIFMEEFEKNTKVNFGNIKDKNKDANLPEKLTSCAGIAFVKKAYPFSRAYELAESLCSYTKGLAKKDNVNYVPSCFSFHKVSASITGDYEDIQKNELTYKDKIKM